MGGRDSWRDEDVGVGRLAAKLRKSELNGVHVETVENLKRSLALKFVKSSLDHDGNGELDDSERSSARIILYGQSFGGAAVVKFARQLNEMAVPVLLTVQIDSVGRGDDVIPANVRTAANFYQNNGWLIHGAKNIRAADPNRTTILFDQTLKMLLLTLRLAGLPFLRPMHRLAADLLKVIYDDPDPSGPVG